MKKIVICLLLTATIICSTSTGIFATDYTNSHVMAADTITMFTHDTNPH